MLDSLGKNLTEINALAYLLIFTKKKFYKFDTWNLLRLKGLAANCLKAKENNHYFLVSDAAEIS